MKLFNTLTQSLETFVPHDDTVRIYVCGVTPYDTTHLGHAFTYLTFDTLIRYLEYTGLTVKYVQNVTDVDDDVIRKAREVGMTWDELGKRETERFLHDMNALHWRFPNAYVKATDEIPNIIKMAQALIEQGYAYVSEGCVFFSVKQDKDFSVMPRALGLKDYQAMLALANQHGNFPDDKRKRDPLDFVLWQAQQPGEPAWESPWGPGRPGWHIECSTIIVDHLGPQIDIHGGGGDLAFPHHTCEIAQSEHYTGVAPFSRFWMHTGMLRQEGEKMSKSLGNLTLVSNLLKEYEPDAIRILIQSHHYRSAWEFFPADIQSAAQTVELFQRVRTLVGRTDAGEDIPLRRRFQDAMENDLNTPEALNILKQAAQSALATHDLASATEILRLTAVLGLCM